MKTFKIYKLENRKFRVHLFTLPKLSFLSCSISFYYFKIVYVNQNYLGPLKRLKYIPSRIKNYFKKQNEKFRFWFKYHLLGSKVYYVAWSRDCDMCEASWSGVCKNIKDYYDMIEDAAEWAEGPFSYDIIKKEEYFPFHSTRDRAFEAYENGRGRSLWV